MTARLAPEDLCSYPLPSGPCGYGKGHTSKHRSVDALGRKATRAKLKPGYGKYNKPKEKASVDRLRSRVSQVKLERGCLDCGYNAHAEALELDHTDATSKVANVATMVSHRASWNDILAEMAKCDVVCANCHRVRTRKRREGASVF